jgi:hypothetical protein
VYTNRRFLELETLGPLALIPPGEASEHIEEWEVLTGLPEGMPPDDLPETF